MLQVNRAYNENDVILMRSKLNIILKLFLHSDIPPRLKVRQTPTLLSPRSISRIPTLEANGQALPKSRVDQMYFT
jgi:hypothetical protein